MKYPILTFLKLIMIFVILLFIFSACSNENNDSAEQLLSVEKLLFGKDFREVSGYNTENKTSGENKDVTENNNNINKKYNETEIFSVKYKHISKKIEGLQQEIYLLETDISNNDVVISPVLSHNRIFGFEKLSEMMNRHNGYAMVNSGFFYEYGEPSGMVVRDGMIVTKSTGKYPVFGIKDGKAFLEVLSTEIIIKTEHADIKIDGLNTVGKYESIIVYTPMYGTTNRAKGKNRTYTVIEGRVVKYGIYEKSAGIPENGIIISCYEDISGNCAKLPLEPGDVAELDYTTQKGKLDQAYECGSWIVRDGKPVTDRNDPWIGVTTNHDPRTVIALKDESTVILMVVDGRNPGTSEGFTAEELARYLIKIGVKDAVMLDGGASSEMIVKGAIVNRPSFKGEERPLGGGLLIKLHTDCYYSQPFLSP
jgi:exopolysaccharide biosynthesis protein